MSGKGSVQRPRSDDWGEHWERIFRREEEDVKRGELIQKVYEYGIKMGYTRKKAMEWAIEEVERNGPVAVKIAFDALDGELEKALDAPPPRARRTDPETSHMAAASMAGDSGGAASQRALIVKMLQDSPDGMTSDEVDLAAGWRSATAGRRMNELEKMKMAEPTGELRLTQSGRQARVWRAVTT